MKRELLIAVAAVAGIAATPVLAQSQGEFHLGVGAVWVGAKDDNGKLANGTLEAEVGNDVRPSLSVDYFIRDNISVGLLAATPFEHKITLNDGAVKASAKHLPPTITLNYHFTDMGQFQPYVGVGLNYTTFWDEDISLAGADLSLDNSWGVAVRAGGNYWLNDKSAVRAEIYWMDIDTDVKLNGDKIGTVKIDPLVANIQYVHKF